MMWLPQKRAWGNGFLVELKLSYLQKCPVHVSSTLFKVSNALLKGKGTSSQEWLRRQMKDPYVKRAHELNYRARSAFKLIEIDDKAKILKPGLTVVECGAAPGAWTQVIVKRINSDGRDTKKRVGTVIGIDLLPIAPLEGAILLGGFDFTSTDTLQMIKEILDRRMIANKSVKTSTRPNSGIRETEMTAMDSKSKGTTSSTDKATLESVDSTTTLVSGKDDKKCLVDVILSDMAPNATGNHATDHPRIVKLVEKALEFAMENGKPGSHFLAKLWDGSETKKLENYLSQFYDKISRHKPSSSRSDSAELFILGKHKK